jgi:C-terminal processing protease CtpA/Prc
MDRGDGVFISRIAPESAVYNSGCLNVGDEIMAVNLVDVTRMSLDDVVIIMSIPRRLVLTTKRRKGGGFSPQPPRPECKPPPVVVIKKELTNDDEDNNNGNDENGSFGPVGLSTTGRMYGRRDYSGRAVSRRAGGYESDITDGYRSPGTCF